MDKIAFILAVSVIVSQIVGYLMLIAWQADEGPLETKERRRIQRASFIFWPFFFFLIGMAISRHIEKFIMAGIAVLAGVFSIASAWSVYGWGDFLDTARITVSGIMTWFVVSLIIAIFWNPAALPQIQKDFDSKEEP
jgi:hypothetical protein